MITAVAARCCHCGEWFPPMYTLGQWQCRIHPGVLDDTRRFYTCCGTPAGAPETAAHDLMPASTTTFVVSRDQIGCLPCDHRLAGIPDGPAGPARHIQVSVVRAPIPWSPAAVVTQRAWRLGELEDAAWTVDIDYVNAYGGTDRVQHDLTGMAKKLVEKEYASAVFQKERHGAGLADQRMVAQDVLGEVAAGLSETELLDAYYRQLPVDAQPPVTIAVIRRAAPTQDPAVLQRARTLRRDYFTF